MVEVTSSKITDVIVSRLRSLKNLKEETAPVGHGSSIGAVRERRLAQLLRSYLPQGIDVETGFVCDCVGGISPQIDVLVCDSDPIPYLEFDDLFKLVPVEKAILCIEVKSTLTTDDISQLNRQIDSIQAMPRCMGNIKEGKGEIPPIFFSLFALESKVGRDAVESLVGSNHLLRQVTVVQAFSVRNRSWSAFDIENIEGNDEFFETRKALCWLINLIDDVLRHRVEKFPLSSRRTAWEPYLVGIQNS